MSIGDIGANSINDEENIVAVLCLLSVVLK